MKHKIIRTSLFSAFLLLFPMSPKARANTLQVGPGKTFSKPCAAIAAASSGDTIQIDTSGNYDGDVCQWSKNNLTLMGVGPGRAVIHAAGNNSQGKAIWVISGNDTVVENIEFADATVPDGNGAGIRQEGKNLTVRNCFFHDNQDGILTGAGLSSTILVEYSEFAHNGAGDGQTHNIYIGNVGQFIFRYNYSHDSVVGHLVKSRAAVNQILYNLIADGPSGTGSYEIDLPNGGRSYIIGNLIEQGPLSQNDNIVAYQEEGPASGNPDHELFVVNNTFVNDEGRGTFVLLDHSVTVPALLQNNIFSGGGTITNQSGAVQITNFVGDAKVVNPAAFNYHLQPGSPAVDKGSNPGTGAGMSLMPVFQYVNNLCAEQRSTAGAAIDIGAYELNGGNGVPPPNAPSGCGSGAPPTPSANLSTTSLGFGNQTVNTTSTAKMVTLSNTGNAALGITGVMITGADSADFAQSNNCGTSLNAGASCTINVNFTPTATGSLAATLVVADNASGSPQTVALSGAGVNSAPPTASLSAQSVSFGSQVVGAGSAAKSLTLTNNGGSTLAISGISVSGANAGDFMETNTCGTNVAAGANCGISVSFKPSSAGGRVATLSVMDGAANSPQSASLSGTAADFSMSLASGSSSSASITAGQTANYSLTITSLAGFTGSIVIACTGAPAHATCSAPSSLNLNGPSASLNISVSTAAGTMLLPVSQELPRLRTFPQIWIPVAISLLLMGLISRRASAFLPRRPLMGMAAAFLAFAALLAGCAGTVSQPVQQQPQGTPKGTYQLTVTGSSQGATHSTNLQLTVN